MSDSLFQPVQTKPAKPRNEKIAYAAGHPIVLLTVNPNTGWHCPYLKCSKINQSLQSSLSHMWKFKTRNACNKKCVGLKNPYLLQIYPKLMNKTQFNNVLQVFTKEFPHYDWKVIRKLVPYMNNSKRRGKKNKHKEMKPQPKQEIKFLPLMLQHQIYIHSEILFQQKISPSVFPKFLQKFIIYDLDDLQRLVDTEFDNSAKPKPKPKTTPKLQLNTKLKPKTKTESEEKEKAEIEIERIPKKNCSEEPPFKRPRLSDNVAKNPLGLTLPILFPNSTSPTRRLNTNSSSLSARSSFLNRSLSPRSPRHSVKKKFKKKYSIGPRCGSCNIELNICDCLIECLECVTPNSNTYLCFNCFATGKQFGSHKRFHKYKILEPVQFEYFNSDPSNSSISNSNSNSNSSASSKHLWNARAEWQFLKGIRKFGLGNWTAIADFMKTSINSNTKFTAYQCEKHYFDYYTEKKATRSRSIPEPLTLRTNNLKLEKDKDEMDTDSLHPLSQESMNNSSIYEVFPTHIQQKLGYKHLRNEFEAEWNNDAEAIISDMYFSEYDTKCERDIKLEGLRLYNNVLQERIKRHNFIFKYGIYYGKGRRGLYNASGNNEQKPLTIKNYTMAIENQIFDNMAQFALYSENKKEFKELILGLIDEKQLREEIYILKKYLLNGVTDVDQMNTIQAFAQQQQLLKHQLDNNMNSNSNSNKKVSKIQIIQIQKLTAKQKNDATFLFNNYIGCSLQAISIYLQAVHNQKSLLQSSKSRRRANPSQMNLNLNLASGQESPDSDIGPSVNQNRRDITQLEGYVALNKSERNLCDILQITPNDYKIIQDEVSKRVYLHGLLRPEQIPQQLHIDIKDVNNVAQSMDIKIGIVEPVPFKTEFNSL